MKETKKSNSGTEKSNGNKTNNGKPIPIIQTLKPKKHYTKLEKELIEAGQAVMDVLIKQKNAEV